MFSRSPHAAHEKWREANLEIQNPIITFWWNFVTEPCVGREFILVKRLGY